MTTAEIIARAEAHASASVAEAIDDLRRNAPIAPIVADDWHADGRHRLDVPRARMLGLLAHLERQRP